MASRLLPLSLSLLGFAGFALAAACGGGGGDDPAPTGTPASDSSAKASPTTLRPGDSRSLQPAGATATPASRATATPTGPLGPEGAAPKITSRSRNAGSEVDNSSGSTEPVTIPFVAPLDDWSGFGDTFGADRGNGLVHGGIDFLLDSHPRASIYAACTGWVAAINTADTYGKHIIVKCDNSQWTTVYAHLGDTLVKLNDKVTAGKTVIARSGGPTPWGPEMLHFELRWDFVPVDPNVHIDLNVRPSRTIPATPTPTGTPTGTPEPGSTPANPGAPGSTPAAPTATPTKTPTPTPTLWYQPTPTQAPPTATPTRMPTSTPTPTPTLPAPTPTPTQLPQTF